MLRIVKRDKEGNAKAVPMKVQEELCKKDSSQNVGKLVNFNRPEVKPRPRHPGLREPGQPKKEKKSGAKTK